jgi:hypothetical protein
LVEVTRFTELERDEYASRRNDRVKNDAIVNYVRERKTVEINRDNGKNVLDRR